VSCLVDLDAWLRVPPKTAQQATVRPTISAHVHAARRALSSTFQSVNEVWRRASRLPKWKEATAVSMAA